MKGISGNGEAFFSFSWLLQSVTFSPSGSQPLQLVDLPISHNYFQSLLFLFFLFCLFFWGGVGGGLKETE